MKRRNPNRPGELLLKCDTCGHICKPKDINYKIYGTGKDKTFGRCPHCGGIGEKEAIFR